MPFICLANGNLPNGTVQVKDLLPNSSQLNPSIDGSYGQSTYINRAQNDTLTLQTDGTISEKEVNGLQAYLIDVVEPGGREQASGTVTAANPAHGDTVTIGGIALTCVENFATGTITAASVQVDDTVTIGGVVFTAKAAENIGARQFDQSGTDAQTIASLRAVVNDSANQALILGAFGATATMAAPTGAASVITSTTRGLAGKLSLVSSNARILLSGLTSNALTLTLAVAGSQQFDGRLSVADNTAVATSIVATVNNATTVTAMKAANATNRYAFASSALGVVTLVARHSGGTTQYGYLGNLTLASSNGTRLAVSGATLARTHQEWTKARLASTAAALLAKVDAGEALTLTAINTLLNTEMGADISGTNTGSRSTGSVANLLSILAGRGYQIGRANASGTVQQFMNVTNPTFQWDVGPRGSFTRAVLVNGTVMMNGEIRPSTVGGDTVQVEHRPIRTIVQSDSFLLSLAAGTLAAFSKVAGAPPVTLWPDSDRVPHFPWVMQSGTHYAQAENARVLTVFDDEGNILE